MIGLKFLPLNLNRGQIILVRYMSVTRHRETIKPFVSAQGIFSFLGLRWSPSLLLAFHPLEFRNGFVVCVPILTRWLPFPALRLCRYSMALSVLLQLTLCSVVLLDCSSPPLTRSQHTRFYLFTLFLNFCQSSRFEQCVILVLICISLLTNGTGNFFICWMDIRYSFF